MLKRRRLVIFLIYKNFGTTWLITDLLAEAIEIQSKLFQNRFGANSQPMRSIEDALLLVSNAKVIAHTMDFIGNDTAQGNTQDMIAGLDGWMTDNDRNLLAIQKAKAHH